MSIVVGTLITMGLQIGASIFNQTYNKKTTAEIKERQRAARLEDTERDIKRDRARFARSCELQKRLEDDSHLERIKNIEQDFIDSFNRLIHKENLESHYRLNISPYIVGQSVIPICGTELKHTRQEVFCILTNSNDKIFNNDVLPYLDELLCDIISLYWNQSSNHTMCYYQNIWNNKTTFSDEDIDNLKTLLVTPTITITPYFHKQSDKYDLSMKINMWGIGKSVSCTIDTAVKYDVLPQKYLAVDIDELLLKLFPPLICSLAQNVDVYYWSHYYYPPILPSLLAQGVLKVDNQILQDYEDVYVELYKSLALGCFTGSKSEEFALVKDVANINQCNFPKRSIGFLRSVTSLTKEGPTSDYLVISSIASLYENKSNCKFDTISGIDVSQLNKDEIDIVSDLIFIAKSCKSKTLTAELTGIVNRKIRSWS